MSELCEIYLKQVKTLFPIMGKEEKKYIQKLSVRLKEYCEDNPPATLEDLYNGYDKPEDVVQEYFSNADTDYIIKRIQKTKLFRILVTVIIIAALSVTTAGISKTVSYYLAYQEAIKDINGYWIDEIY